MANNKICLVKNRSAGMVVYKIPEEGVRREFQPGETKKIAFTELEKLTYQPGGRTLIANFLQITDEKVFFEIKENGEIVKANMKNERIPFDVPKTSIGDSKIVNLIVFIGIALGIGFLIYDKKRNK